MIYQLNLDELRWEGIAWKSFCKYAKRRYKNLKFPALGIVDLYDESDCLSEYEANIIIKGILSDYMDDKCPLEQYNPINQTNAMLLIKTMRGNRAK